MTNLTHLHLVHKSSLLLELDELLKSLIHGDQLTLVLSALVISVADVDRA